MSEKQNATGALQSTDEAEILAANDNPMPAPPAKPDVTTLGDNPMPAPPAKPDVTTLGDNPMPAPPALGADSK